MTTRRAGEFGLPDFRQDPVIAIPAAVPARIAVAAPLPMLHRFPAQSSQPLDIERIASAPGLRPIEELVGPPLAFVENLVASGNAAGRRKREVFPGSAAEVVAYSISLSR